VTAGAFVDQIIPARPLCIFIFKIVESIFLKLRSVYFGSNDLCPTFLDQNNNKLPVHINGAFLKQDTSI
jgi:hypothetical protein